MYVTQLLSQHKSSKFIENLAKVIAPHICGIQELIYFVVSYERLGIVKFSTASVRVYKTQPFSAFFARQNSK